MSIKPLIYNRRTAEEVRDLLKTLKSPNKIPITAIENAVTSVNGMTGDVVIGTEIGDFQPRSDVLTTFSEMNVDETGMLWQEEGSFTVAPVSQFVRRMLSSPNESFYRGMLGLGDSAMLDVNVPFGIATLDEDGKLPAEFISMEMSDVAKTGSYNDLLDKPEIPVVDYPVMSVNSKTGNITLTNADIGSAPVVHQHGISDIEGLQSALDSKVNQEQEISYNSLSDTPVLSTVAISGSYNDLNNKPAIFSGKYSDLVGKPSLFDGTWDSLAGKPAIPPGQVNADWNATSGRGQILNKPTLFDGDYNSLKNKPTIPTVSYPVTSVNSKTGAISLTNTDVGAAPAVHSHSITDVSGLQAALDLKLNASATIPYSSISGTPSLHKVATSGSYADLTNKPVIPANTSQISEGTNLYYTDARVNNLLATGGFRKTETLQGTTNSSGVYQVTFANTYSTPPHVNPVIINGLANQILLVSNITTTGCTITVVQRAAVTVLNVEVLLAATTPVSGATIGVLVVAK